MSELFRRQAIRLKRAIERTAQQVMPRPSSARVTVGVVINAIETGKWLIGISTLGGSDTL